MTVIYTKHERILLYIILGFLLFNSFFKPPKNTIIKQPKVRIIRDTIWQTKIDSFPVQTIKYQKVYVHKNSPTKIVNDTIFIKDTTNFITANIYKDTLNNTELEIYSYNLVKGKLLDSNISYKLKVPKEVRITKTITHPKSYKSGLFLFSEIGGNINKFNNISLGMQYNRKGKWFTSYRLNINQLHQPTHNIGVGFRLFN
ncbi:hypothetical protein [Tenacibaculum maritimum]|uniref:hypothetical protein n=1 Tax=Tenacibaculum maritimum TaxID=107401 RepID=UPI0012E6984D|nr:hypothetical protein [Tenacibaculum maritimum]MCD9581865.1 hypothetical protein [Tenacibaculum maritimum]MCD9636263.1 hypothetical protein [Tenacibaculum maritimum]CAA0204586.1 conserved hypothetical protein [Tenacibaculum maritimum]